MLALIRKYPLTSYFVLAFVLSWGAVLTVIAPGPLVASSSEAERLFPWVFLGMLLGPAGAGILMTAAIDGSEGLRVLGQRVRKWRVSGRWYLIALLTAPVVLTATLLLLAQLSPDFTPGFLGAGDLDASGPARATSLTGFLLLGIAVGIGAGFFEEIGWTGFATPALRARHGDVAAALLLGIMWGAWHFLVTLWGGADTVGAVPASLYMIITLFSFLPPYRILMTWVYGRTESLLIAVLMHSSLTSSTLILGAPVQGYKVLAFNLVVAILLWGIVGVVHWKTSSATTARLVTAAR